MFRVFEWYPTVRLFITTMSVILACATVRPSSKTRNAEHAYRRRIVRAYAAAYLHTVQFGHPIVEHLQFISQTLEPFCGRFLVHDGG